MASKIFYTDLLASSSENEDCKSVDMLNLQYCELQCPFAPQLQLLDLSFKSVSKELHNSKLVVGNGSGEQKDPTPTWEEPDLVADSVRCSTLDTCYS